MERDLVIVSLHEKGFWQADMYDGWAGERLERFNQVSPSPDDFFTRSKGGTMEDAINHARQRWPGAKIEIADEEDNLETVDN